MKFVSTHVEILKRSFKK